MAEPWLRSNRRAIAAGFAVPVVLATIALVLAILPWAWWWKLSAIVPLAAAAVISWSLWKLVRQPRLAYEHGFLLVYLSASFIPERVPIEFVECFFLGEGPSLLPQPVESSPPARTQTIIIRIADSARDWQQRPVKPELGKWCDGYITIRGTWSEPIRPTLVQELNARLVDIHRSLATKSSR